MPSGKKNRPKERERYYLFPGQGGRSFRRKQQRLVLWATVFALLFGGILGAILFWVSRMKPL